MDNARHTRTEERGFTLVEAVVTMAVLAIVATISVPSLARFLDTRRLNAAAQALATDLQLARTDAVARNRVLRLGVQASGSSSCWILHTGAAGACTCTGATTVCAAGDVEIRSERYQPADRLRIEANVTSMAFDPLHGTSTPAGTLRVVAGDGRSVQHIVNAMGRARTCSPGGLVAGHRSC